MQYRNCGYILFDAFNKLSNHLKSNRHVFTTIQLQKYDSIFEHDLSRAIIINNINKKY